MYVLFTDNLLIEDDNFVVGGQIGILDLTNVTPEHFSQFKPEIVKKLTYLCQDSSPVRPKGFHYVNTPHGFEFVLNMFKSFMSDEYKELVSQNDENEKSIAVNSNDNQSKNVYGLNYQYKKFWSYKKLLVSTVGILLH